MHVSNTITKASLLVDIQGDDGEVYKYVRLEPYFWVWINSSRNTGMPMISELELEDIYAKYLSDNAS